jgi:hypothetical protein
VITNEDKQNLNEIDKNFERNHDLRSNNIDKKIQQKNTD